MTVNSNLLTGIQDIWRVGRVKMRPKLCIPWIELKGGGAR